MSHASKLLLLSCLVGTFACIVPPIEELDKDKPITKCNAEHPTCPPGAVCFEDRCIKTEGLGCTPGERRPCGLDKGECRPGSELCGAEGVFGACENPVTPVFEKCDDKDNDCDGTPDEWDGAVTLTRAHDAYSAAAALLVRRAADGSKDTLLTLTSEERSIVSRTLAADGSWTLGRRFPPPTDGELKLPALAAHGDVVAAAWLAVKPGLQTGTSLYQIVLLLMDGSGLPITQPIAIPHGDPNVLVTQLQLAINKTHVLVLFMAGNQSFVVTVPRNLDEASLKGPFPLGKVQANRPLNRWFQATVGGTWEQFVVAYEDYTFNQTNGFTNYFTYTATVSNDGELFRVKNITKDAYSQSPFILPTPGDWWEYSVYFAEPGYDPLKPTETRISTLLCREIACETASAFGYFNHAVLRMQMVAPPGALKPEMALFKWQDGRTNPMGLTAITFADKAPLRNELTPLGEPTLFESLIVMPDSTRYLLYNQFPPPPPQSTVSSQAIGSSTSEAYLRPFCSP